MKHPERIEDYLQHIAEAIDRITGYVQGIDNAAALERDHKTQAAVIRYIEIIGEAANRIQKQEPGFVAAHPPLPWHEMRGMRNRMIHNYFGSMEEFVGNIVGETLLKTSCETEKPQPLGRSGTWVLAPSSSLSIGLSD